jgi:hypothetical protein
MAAPRLATSVMVGALRRLAESQGGFATVLARGDESAGAVTLILLEKGGKTRILERALQGDGSYQWQSAGPQAVDNEEEVRRFLARRREIDPDMWILELDIACAERFAAEINSIG